MCGIAGILSPQGLQERPEGFYQQVLSTMTRRGPDQEGKFFTEHCALLHRRLSVIDPEKGRQPMQEGPYAIVYNGELYNTPELRKSLIGLGETFRTTSDTEVLLKAYIRWGEKCLGLLNGIFAFAVYDRENRRLFFARDPIGVKPLFYAERNGSFLFASELKTLLKFPEVEARLGPDGLYQILFMGPGRAPGSGVFEGVREIKPGWYGTFDEDGLTLKQYWMLKDAPCQDTFTEAAEKVRYLLEDSIQRQLVSDVPVGTFLSGGLDSSIVSAVAAKNIQSLETYSVDYRDNEKYFKATKFQPNSDSDYITLMADHIGANSNMITLETEQLVDALFEAAEARDLPGMADVDSSMLLLCREARKSSTVVLSGECADEIFGGYPWFRDPTIRETAGFPWAQTTDYRETFLQKEFIQSAKPQDYVNHYYRSTLAEVDILPDTSPLERRMKEMMVLNMKWFMQTLLDRKDRMSMWSGLEVRVPFCDKRVVEYLYTLPWSYKDYQGMEKGLLRHAFRDLLPREVCYRKKSPYPKTWNPDYKQKVTELLMDELSSESPLLTFLDKNALTTLCQEERSLPWYGQLMTTPQTIAYFLQMAHWMRINHVTIS